jgi:hypothetical protein
MVHGRANGLREAAVIHVRRNGLLDFRDVLEAQPVQLLGGDARLHVFPDHVENLAGQAASHTHFFLLD